MDELNKEQDTDQQDTSCRYYLIIKFICAIIKTSTCARTDVTASWILKHINLHASPISQRRRPKPQRSGNTPRPEQQWRAGGIRPQGVGTSHSSRPLWWAACSKVTISRIPVFSWLSYLLHLVRYVYSRCLSSFQFTWLTAWPTRTRLWLVYCSLRSSTKMGVKPNFLIANCERILKLGNLLPHCLRLRQNRIHETVSNAFQGFWTQGLPSLEGFKILFQLKQN